MISSQKPTTRQQTFSFLEPPSPPTNDIVLLPPQPPAIKCLDQPISVPEPTAATRPVATPTLDRQSVLRDLRTKVGCINTIPPTDRQPVLSTGSALINGLLPRGGLRLDAVTEWVAEAEGCGADALAMIVAAIQLQASSGPLVIVSGKNFYPPAAVALGVPAERIILVRPTRHADVVWAIDQSLRCQSVAAVWAHVGPNLDDRDARRFQLAAEAGCTPGLFIRPAAVRRRPSFADVRFHVANPARPANIASPSPLGRSMQLTLDRCRGGTVGHSVWIQVDDQARILPLTHVTHQRSHHETAAVRLASELANPATSAQQQTKRRRRA
jgi:protein ImuA